MKSISALGTELVAFRGADGKAPGVPGVHNIDPGVPLQGSIRVPLRGSFKVSIGGLGFRTDDRNPALP